MGGLVKTLKKIDDLAYSVEKFIVTLSLITMSLIVFLDVLWRITASPDSKTAVIIIFILERVFSIDLSSEFKTFLTKQAGQYIGLVILWFFVHMGITLRPQKEPLTPLKRSLLSLLVTGGIVASAYLIRYIFEDGFPYSQRVALSLLLWVGFLGGSMATRANRHIQGEVATKFMKKDTKRVVTGISRLIAALFCFFLMILGARYCYHNFIDWYETGSSVFDILPIPYWTVTLSIPAGFFRMATRFLFYGIGNLFLGIDPEVGEK